MKNRVLEKRALKNAFKITLISSLFLAPLPTNSSAATKITPGASCKVLNQKATYQNKIFTCIKSGKKLIWNKGVQVKKQSPTPKPTPATPTPATPTPTPTPTTDSTPTQTPSKSATPTAANSGYTLAQVKANNSRQSCWTIIDNYVYDLTRWINSHPGGASAILSLCGVDGSAAFNSQHENQSKPAVRLDSYKLGPLAK
jgi:cytochrome b involved in lipid metabolism